MRLSDHFSLAEAMKSQAALRLGIDNTPPPEVLPALVRVATGILEPVRRHTGIPFRPSSWYRCPALNSAIGGAAASQHTKGEAVDFEVPGVANIQVARFIEGHIAFDQLILEFYREGEANSGWVHCSLRHEGNRRQALRFDGTRTLAGLTDNP